MIEASVHKKNREAGNYPGSCSLNLTVKEISQVNLTNH